MKNIFSKTTENRTQNGVKSYLSPTFVLSPILIFAFLTLGFGQVWADNGDFYNMYIAYSFEGAGGAINGNDNNTGVTVDAGTLTSGSLTLTGVYLKCWDDWGNNYKSSGGQLCYTNKGGNTQYVNTGFTRSNKSGNNYEYQNSNPGLTIASYDQASGSFEFHCWGQTWGEKWGDRYFPKSSGHYVLKYKIAPPAVSGFGVTTSGYLAGSGTEGDPYLVASGSNLTLTASGSQAHTDVKSSINYKFGDDAYSTTATKNITVTSSGSIAVKACCKNTSAPLDGAETETITIYYVPVKDITVYIYVGGCTPAQINSIELFGTPCVGSKALAAVHILAAGFTTDGDWRKYTFTNVSEVRNVVVAREGGRAVDNITITDDIYYKFDGTNLGGKCVPPSLTWTTAPADGKVGNNMTAAVNTTPVSGGSPSVTWSTSNSNIADVNESTGVISYKAAGSATITARVTWSATGDYCAGSSDLAQTITVSAPSQEPVLGAVTATPSGQPNYARPPIDFELSVTSTYLAHPVVVFFVNDGTTTYEVVGAPYGAEGNSAVGTIGADAANTTVHKATFTATKAKTYTVSAKLYEGLLVENFETADYTTWVAVNEGSSSIEPNLSVSANNGSPKVRQITPNGTDWHTSLTSSTGKWVNGYQYIHTKMYYTAGGELRFKISDAPVVELAVAHGTNKQWNKVVFNNSGKANINFMFPWIVSNTSTFYIDDIILSNEASMTMLAETAPASFSIKSEITRITFSPGNIVAPSATVSVTATVELTPVEQTTICWRVLYSNDNPLDPQPTFTPANQGNSVSFIAPEARGSYKVEATLREGADCNGEEMHTFTAPFQVAGDHTVTVQYKCGNTTIKASTSATGKPLDWTPITAPEIVGYSFLKWVEGDGITIEGATNGEKADATINFKAIYDGKLTAVYTKKNMIYFNNTLGWSDVYVYFYNSNEYWSGEYGSGAQQTQAFNGNHQPYWEGEHGKMTRIEGTNIWYFDYTAVGYTTRLNVVFTERDQHGNQWFHQTNVVRRGDHKSSLPMFVPLNTKSDTKNECNYYNEGYWMCYPNYSGYTLKIYNTEDRNKEPTAIKSFDFPYSDGYVLPMSVDVDLEANKKYYFDVYRNDNTLFGNNGDMKYGNSGPWSFFNTDTRRAGITTTAAGNYRFTWSFFKASSTYNYHMTVTYPVAPNDYRVIYTDNATWTKAHTARTWYHPSRIISAKENAVDTISFFVSKGHSPEFKIQQVVSIDEGTGAITWKDVTDWISCDDVDASGVYNFIITQYAYNRIGCTKIEMYTGNYYIRTDAANSKWDNYRSDPDHLMTYSEYSKDHSDYTHYFVKFVREGTNVKFVVANDYSPCISDTLIQSTYRGSDASHVDEHGFLNNDLPGDGVNVRYMWDIRNNAVMRAYLAPAQKNGSKFLVLRSNSSEDLRDEYDDALTGDSEGFPGNNHGGGANCMQFVDNENWIYEATVMVRPSAYVKLYGFFHGDNFYYKGTEDDIFDDTHAIKLVEGSGARVKVRVIYDFKTDRLVAAYLPSGNIDEEMAINADVMFIREHQGDIEQLTFSEKDSKMGAITNIKTAYAVMRFNKWTLNNKEKDTHNPLASPASIYERAMYFISFPFEVKLSEVFGFGTYGQDWIIEYYDGAERARTGWWEGQPGFWRYVWDRKNFVLKPNVGYLLELELGNFKEGSGFWNNNNERLELFFPSSGNLGLIISTTVNCSIPEHACTINRAATEGLPDTPDNPRTSYNRTIFDSHWNVMSVPTYVNATPNEWSNTTWRTAIGPKFLYTWNMEDNTLTATSAVDYRYHAMHAYMVQYGGNVQWVTSGTKPAAIVARNTYAEEPKEVEFRLEIQQNEKMVDQTFVIMSNDDQINANFQFGEDMSKDFNARNANIYTMTADNVAAAGNSLPMSENTTIVPVGVSVKKTGDYTFSIPDGTNGVGITLIDEETGIRTSLSALDYTVNLAAGDYTERFWLEISPIQNTPTGMEDPTSDSSLKGRAQKRIIDGVLYIVKDGKIFDARGTRVE
ncbi:MAG: hypothetical protein SPF23_00645 [Paludibacteraceae bacterium]|nr:hypothetical protein [Paludibacteraceae bacterium]